MKHLKSKKEFKYKGKDKNLLDTFPKPENIDYVYLQGNEFTSLCPITGQPDYHIIKINYRPLDLCLESKSLKLYLGSFRQEGCFTETLSSIIAADLSAVLNTPVEVTISSVSRGGVEISATSTCGRIG